ncbi:MAG: hypothetical protein Ct9H300mP8_02010 [Gammaproteobacteria bacterium]|nr:MAG: hypothetical protein Ct9H300mP8_02010 [Gammaproteobacteria bacterium]
MIGSNRQMTRVDVFGKVVDGGEPGVNPYFQVPRRWLVDRLRGGKRMTKVCLDPGDRPIFDAKRFGQFVHDFGFGKSILGVPVPWA